MPNWTYDQWRFTGEPVELTKLYINLVRATGGFGGLTEKEREYETTVKDADGKEHVVKRSVRDDWFGNMLLASGYSMKDIDSRGLSCRGSIISVSQDDNGVSMSTECAWNPFYETVSTMIEECYPNINMVMLSEEPGMGIFINTDIEHTYFAEKYYFYYSDDKDDCIEEYLKSDEGLLEKLEEVTGQKAPASVTDICEQIEWQKKYFDEHLSSEDCNLIIEEYTNY